MDRRRCKLPLPFGCKVSGCLASLGSAGSTIFQFPLKHGVCCRPVKTCERGATPRRGAIFLKERVRLVEEAVLKTAAPSSVSKVRFLGAPPIFCPHGAIAARPTFYRKTPERYRVRVPFCIVSISSPDSSIVERPAYIRLTGERYLVGRPLLYIPP